MILSSTRSIYRSFGRSAFRSLFSAALCSALLMSCAGDGDGAAEDNDSSYADRMAKEHANDTPTGNEVAWMEPAGPVSGEDVEYATIDGKGVSGYFARPSGEDSTAVVDSGIAGIVVIHEWWGLNDNIDAMARRLAGDGYMALAIDLYNGQVASTPDQAKQYMGEVNQEKGTDNIRQAIEFLQKKGATKIGVIGWCFGGGWSLTTATHFPEQIAAAVIYYGHLNATPDELSRLKMPVLGIFGAEDDGIPVEHVRHFESQLDSLGVNASVHVYDNAAHAFANPSGDRYNAEAAQDAWTKTSAFLAEHLK